MRTLSIPRLYLYQKVAAIFFLYLLIFAEWSKAHAKPTASKTTNSPRLIEVSTQGETIPLPQLKPQVSRHQTFNSTRIQKEPDQRKKQLMELLNQRTYQLQVNPPTSKQIGFCNNIGESLLALSKTSARRQQRLERILRHTDFKIFCTTDEIVKERFGKGESSQAFFSRPNRGIFVSPKLELTSIGTDHETFHADQLFIHQGKCFIGDNDQSYSPVYPVNAPNIAAYNRAFDRGDKRVQKFEELWLKQSEGKKLSKPEQHLLESYLKAARTCHMDPFETEISPSVYSIFKNANGKEVKGKSTSMHVDSIIQSAHYNEKEKKFYAMVTADPVLRFLILRGEIAEIPSLYKGQPPEILLAEREAVTFSGLSDEAMDTFYPEASKLYDQHISTCTRP